MQTDYFSFTLDAKCVLGFKIEGKKNGELCPVVERAL